MLDQWQTEIKKHSKPNSIKLHEYYGKGRKFDMDLGQFDVVLTTYDILAQEYDRMQSKCSFEK